MAEESLQEKTETPTERKREEIRREGRVAYSREITGAIILGAVIVGFYFGGKTVLNTIMAMMSSLFSNLDWGELSAQTTVDVFQFAAGDLIQQVIFYMGGLFLLGVLVGIMQLGFRISLHPIQPNLNKINPLKGFGRIFSLSNIVDGFKITVKVIIIGVIVYLIIVSDIAKIASFSGMDYISFLSEMWEIIIFMLLKLFAAFLLIAGFDFIWQKFNFERQIKMTKQEYKDDMKQSEGDPMIKARIRQIQQKMSRARMLQEVPTSDVVITNPTHYAVVLKYDTEFMDAPQLVAKGVDYLALRIIEIAENAGVVVTRRPEVARSLYGSLEIGDSIPAEFYQVIAEILATAYRAKGKKFQPTANV